MKKLLNTLFVTTEDAYLSLDGENVVISKDRQELARFPLHTLSGIIAFTYAGASPALMGGCAERGVSLSFCSPSGSFLARKVGEENGNVLLRRMQYRVADDPSQSCRIARNMIFGKLYNSRWSIERTKRDHGMRVDAEKDGVARLSTGEHDDRITPVGRVIRKTRIDELPQLVDILKGDLSVVGPRSERPEIAAQYEETMPEFQLRLQAKAGLTGYAQVYGKYNTRPYDKLKMDLMYISRPSVIEDLRICFATVKILFMPESTEGISEGQTTAMSGENH